MFYHLVKIQENSTKLSTQTTMMSWEGYLAYEKV